MYSQGDIEAAVAAGALTPDQASNLRAFVSARNQTPTADEEYYRVYRGFNDVYVLYTVILTLVTVGWIGSLIPLGGSNRAIGPLPVLPFLAPLFVAGASWGLAEIFTRRRRTALPSLFLAFIFGFAVLLTLVFLIAPSLDGGPASASVFGALCCALAAGASWLFGLRFRQPISPMLVVGFGVLGVIVLISGLFALSPGGTDVLNVVVLLMGFAVFAAAMWWDGSDPWRVTERSETGLWMHGLAAALIVFPIIHFLGLRSGVTSVGGALAFLVFYILFAFVALAVNRKALLLTAISPFFVALNTLIPSGGGGYGGYGARNRFGAPNPLDAFGGTVLTLLLVSLVMLALAIWWAPLRRVVTGILPASLQARMPAEPAPYAPPAAPYLPPQPPQPPMV